MRVGEDVGEFVAGICGGRSGNREEIALRCIFFGVRVCEESNAGITCVPPVVTGGPWRRALEGVIEVEDGPGQHHDVVDVEVGDDDLGRHSDPCGTECSRVCLAACWNIFIK